MKSNDSMRYSQRSTVAQVRVRENFGPGHGLSCMGLPATALCCGILHELKKSLSENTNWPQFPLTDLASTPIRSFRTCGEVNAASEDFAHVASESGSVEQKRLRGGPRSEHSGAHA